MSTQNFIVIYAFNKGYYVDQNGDVFSPNGKILTQNKNKKGYFRVGIRYKNKTISLMVHKLVAYQKYGNAIFKNGIEIRHLNNISTDNSFNNISIGTHSDNMMDIAPLKRKTMAGHPKYDHKKILKDRKDGMTYKKIMDKYNISSKGTVSFIVNKSLVSKKID